MSAHVMMVNGAERAVSFVPGTPLAKVLREGLGLASVRDDIEAGVTGASTVLVGEFAMLAALLPADLVVASPIVTAEGLANHPLAASFRHHGVDRLAAAPALLVAGAALLAANTRPTVDDIRRALAGVRCPGTGYGEVIAAIQDAAAQILRAMEVRP